MNKFLLALLDEKEERAQRQKELIKKYKKSLISFALNIPGGVKNSKDINNFFTQVLKHIKNQIEKEKFVIIYEEIKNEITGNLAFLIIDSKQSIKLKKFLVTLEEKLKYGRILDIDVFDEEHNLISRADLGLNKRKCLLCEKDAIYCIKNKSHNYEELMKKTMTYINKIY